MLVYEQMKTGGVSTPHFETVDRRQRDLHCRERLERSRARVAAGELGDRGGGAQAISACRPQRILQAEQCRVDHFELCRRRRHGVGVEVGVDLLGRKRETVESRLDGGEVLWVGQQGARPRGAVQCRVDCTRVIAGLGQHVDERRVARERRRGGIETGDELGERRRLPVASPREDSHNSAHTNVRLRRRRAAVGLLDGVNQAGRDQIRLPADSGFDHHPHHGLGTRRPHEHPTVVTELGDAGGNSGIECRGIERRRDRQRARFAALGETYVITAASSESERPVRAMASSSMIPVSVPSPVVAWSAKMMWPDCSPPSTSPRSVEHTDHVAVAHRRLHHVDAAAGEGVPEPEVRHDRDDDGIASQHVTRRKIDGGDAQHVVAVDDVAVLVDRDHTIGVTIERKAGIGARHDHRGPE